ALERQGGRSESIGLWRAYVDAHRGDLEAVSDAFAGARTEEPIVRAIWSRCLGLAELSAGEDDEAARHLAEALAELDRLNFREPAIWRVHGDAIEAAVANGELERAERELAVFEERARSSCIPWSLAVSARCRAF